MAIRKEVFGVTIEGDITGLKSAMNEATKVFNSTSRALKNVQKQLNLDPTNVDLLRKKQELFVKSIHEEEKALEELKKMREDVLNDENFAKGYDDLKEKFTELDLEITKHEQHLKDLKKEYSNMPSAEVEAFATKLDKVGNNLIDLSNKTRVFSAAMAGVMTASFEAAKYYETNIANIKRIIADLSDETIKDLKDIAVETGTAFSDVSEYATFAGALGLAEDKVASFTKTMIDLNTATGGAFGGEEGAKSVVVFLNALGVAVDEAENFGSAIAVVGDKYADIGDETLRIATNLSGLSTIAKVDQYDLIGLAGVMANLGLSGEAATSGITRAFVQIEKAIAGGGDELEGFANASHKTVEEFVRDWHDKPLETFMDFVDSLKGDIFYDINNAIDKSSDKVQKYADLLGMSAETFKDEWAKNADNVFTLIADKLADMDEEGTNAISTLTGVKLTSIRTIQTLLRLAGQGEEVASAVQLANDAWNENTALQEKANTIYDTTERKIQGMFESLKQLGSALTEDVLPFVKDGIDEFTNLLKKFSELNPKTKELILSFIAIGASLSPLERIFGTSIKSIGKLTKSVDAFIRQKWPRDYLDNMRSVNSVLHEMGQTEVSLLGVGGAIGGIVLALGGLAYYAYQNNPVRLIKEEVEGLNSAFDETVQSSDAMYQANVKAIDSVGFYAEQIDLLTEKLKDNTLTAEERQRIQDKITEYLGNLNSALGSEEFYFDTTTGKIVAQGEEIDKVKDKFNELAFTAKKQAWLDAHSEMLTDAYSNLDRANELMDQATSDFVKSIDGIPRNYVQLFEEVGGDLEAFGQKLRENGLPNLDTGDMAALQNAWDNYIKKMQEATTMSDKARDAIKNYEDVASSTIENFDSLVTSIQEKSVIVTDSTKSMVDNLVLVDEKINALKGVLTEDQEQNNILLDTYEQQREKLQAQYDIETNKYNKLGELIEKHQEEAQAVAEGITVEQQKLAIVDEILSSAEGVTNAEIEFIDRWNNWTPETKTLTVVFNTVGGIPGGYGGSGGFGSLNSGGYGDIISNLASSINRSIANFRSGGFKSGGLTNNVYFNVSSNNIGREQVKAWATWIVDDLNEALGKQI